MCALVDEVIRLTNERYASMSPFEFGGLKQTLSRFFADKRVKVSLFLADGLQKQDGTITITGGGPLPPGCEMPGMISYFDTSGYGMGTDTFTAPHAAAIPNEQLGPPLDPRRQAACPLGQNLYTKEKVVTPPPAQQAAQAEAAHAVGHGSASGGASRPKQDSALLAAEILSAGDTHARTDLNMLADLIGSAPSTGEFKLNLFPDTGIPGEGGGGAGRVGGTQTIVIDVGKGSNAANRELMGMMDDMNVGDGDGAGDDPDDLLSMMDSAQH